MRPWCVWPGVAWGFDVGFDAQEIITFYELARRNCCAGQQEMAMYAVFRLLHDQDEIKVIYFLYEVGMEAEQTPANLVTSTPEELSSLDQQDGETLDAFRQRVESVGQRWATAHKLPFVSHVRHGRIFDIDKQQWRPFMPDMT